MAWGICGKFLPQVIFRADSLRSGGSGRLGVTCVVIRSSPSLLPHQTLVSDSGAGQRGSIVPGDWGRVVAAPQEDRDRGGRSFLSADWGKVWQTLCAYLGHRLSARVGGVDLVGGIWRRLLEQESLAEGQPGWNLCSQQRQMSESGGWPLVTVEGSCHSSLLPTPRA